MGSLTCEIFRVIAPQSQAFCRINILVPDDVVLYQTSLVQSEILDPLLLNLFALNDGMILLSVKHCDRKRGLAGHKPLEGTTQRCRYNGHRRNCPTLALPLTLSHGPRLLRMGVVCEPRSLACFASG